MLLDDLLEVARRDMPIPHALGIHDDDGALVMLLIAAHAGCANHAQSAILDDITKSTEEPFATELCTSVSSHSCADEHMQFPGWYIRFILHADYNSYAAVTL